MKWIAMLSLVSTQFVFAEPVVEGSKATCRHYLSAISDQLGEKDEDNLITFLALDNYVAGLITGYNIGSDDTKDFVKFVGLTDSKLENLIQKSCKRETHRNFAKTVVQLFQQLHRKPKQARVNAMKDARTEEEVRHRMDEFERKLAEDVEQFLEEEDD